MRLITKKKEKFVWSVKKDLNFLIKNFADFVEINVMIFIAKERDNTIKINSSIVLLLSGRDLRYLQFYIFEINNIWRV